jgi:hypothetical protein
MGKTSTDFDSIPTPFKTDKKYSYEAVKVKLCKQIYRTTLGDLLLLGIFLFLKEEFLKTGAETCRFFFFFTLFVSHKARKV